MMGRVRQGSTALYIARETRGEAFPKNDSDEDEPAVNLNS